MAKKKILATEKTGKSIALSTMADAELVALRAKLEIEMRRRNLGFSVGAIGETLVTSHYTNTPGLPTMSPAPTGTKNMDAISRDGDRYSIKSIWKAKKTGTIYPDPNNHDKQLFEYIIIAVLNDEFALKSIYEFSWDMFTKVRSWDTRMSAWYIPCSIKTLALARKIL